MESTYWGDLLDAAPRAHRYKCGRSLTNAKNWDFDQSHRKRLQKRAGRAEILWKPNGEYNERRQRGFACHWVSSGYRRTACHRGAVGRLFPSVEAGPIGWILGLGYVFRTLGVFNLTDHLARAPTRTIFKRPLLQWRKQTE